MAKRPMAAKREYFQADQTVWFFDPETGKSKRGVISLVNEKGVHVQFKKKNRLIPAAVLSDPYGPASALTCGDGQSTWYIDWDFSGERPFEEE